MSRTYKRGEIYYADLAHGVGSEQEGRRPVVVIQNDVGNKHSPTVIVAAVTTKAFDKRKKLPVHYALDDETGLKAPSVVMLEQIRTLDKHRLEQYVGKLPPKQLKELNHALAISVGLIDPKPKSMTLCLCRTCVDNFFNTGAYFLKRIDPYQIVKETCTYCNQRNGYDYLVDKK